MDGDIEVQESVGIQLGVLLARSTPLREDETRGDAGWVEPDELEEDLDETGHAPAWGRRGRHVAAAGSRVAQLGQDVLRAAAEAVGREIALVVGGVISGIEQPRDGASSGGVQTGSFAIDDVELKFGVKATLGAGKAVEAFFTASGEATVEVTLTLRQP